ncbi:MAG: hypothetical protein OEX76_05375 [Candidatus Bathyarchaeota archaeon]|nr:hypothetical protein [Candidatus Bathyarchaeota archaeon]MDH5712433.1 hypothetical protein [Candidatus Bathyarchaeota archaeon]
MDIAKPSIVVGVNKNYYGMYVPSLKIICLTSLTNEFNVEWILSHEIMHHVLEHRINHETSVKLDNVDFDIWALLHHDSGETSYKPFKDENILRKTWRVITSFFAKLPSGLLSKWAKGIDNC